MGSIGFKLWCLYDFDTDTLELSPEGIADKMMLPKSDKGYKCMAGLNATNYEIAIASEGSFYTSTNMDFASAMRNDL